jgi:hypothetical protein
MAYSIVCLAAAISCVIAIDLLILFEDILLGWLMISGLCSEKMFELNFLN